MFLDCCRDLVFTEDRGVGDEQYRKSYTGACTVYAGAPRARVADNGGGGHGRDALYEHKSLHLSPDHLLCAFTICCQNLGLLSTSLSEYLGEPNVEIHAMIRRVARRVYDESDGQQQVVCHTRCGISVSFVWIYST